MFVDICVLTVVIFMNGDKPYLMTNINIWMRAVC